MFTTFDSKNLEIGVETSKHDKIRDALIEFLYTNTFK